jgi:molybdenum cofactor biosynthesis enzyme MoaA
VFAEPVSAPQVVAPPRPTETLFHVTVLSNFARAYDKYSQCYSKGALPQSTFPDRFFLLTRDELPIGITKAGRLLAKLELPGDRLLVLETQVESSALRANTRTGLGRYIEQPFVRLSGVHLLDGAGALEACSVEEAYALSLRVLHPALPAFEALRPRTVSLLPMARGCEAQCSFCFSEASISAIQAQHPLPAEAAAQALAHGKARGAERAVITGGGEPGLLPFERLLELVRLCAAHFPQKVVLISNGLFLARRSEEERREMLGRLDAAGLTVLSLSRHHHGAANDTIMRVATHVERVFATFRAHPPRALRPRLIAVLQRGGIDSEETLEAYLRWAAAQGVGEVTFKELYVSTSHESVFHSHASNRFSRERQVSLSLVTDFFAARGWPKVAELPWGSPVHAGEVDGVRMQVAAYTEPSLFWERAHGVARSWNVLADGSCYVSLEDAGSKIEVA